jgi:N-methylhydantoinase B
VERLTVNSIIVVHEGDVIETHNSGGGGFGPAHARPISAVLEDVRAGVVSVDAAFHDYRVLIDGEVVTDLRAAVERTTATPDSDPIPLVLATSQP